MANNLLIGVTIGAVLSGSYQTAFSNAGNTVKKLGSATEDLKKRQERLGRVMSRAMSHPLRDVGNLRREYEKLGSSVDNLQKRQGKLTASIARGNALSEKRKELHGQMMGTAAAAFATGAPIVNATRAAAGYEDSLREVSIKANFSREQERELGKNIMHASIKGLQERNDILGGIADLHQAGASFEQIKSYTGLLAQTMTALGNSNTETAGAMTAIRNMGMGELPAMKNGLDVLVAIGKQGQFSSAQMIKTFGELAPVIKEAGLSGEKTLAQMSAGLQVATPAMGAAGAQSGLQGWIGTLEKKETSEAYEKAGIAYDKSMAGLIKKGLTKFEASIEIANRDVFDKLSTKQKQALLKGDTDGRVLKKLQEMGLGEVFADSNTARFALEIGRNKPRYKELSQTTPGKAAGALDSTFEFRADTAAQNMKALKLEASNLGVTVGATVLPHFTAFLKQLNPIVTSIGIFAEKNPGLVSGLVGVVSALLGAKIGFLAVKYTVLSVLSPINSVITLATTLSAKYALLAPSVTKFIGATGKLVPALKLGAGAFKTFGLTMLASPMTWILAGVVGLATAAYLIYDNWDSITGFFSDIWSGIDSMFNGGIAGLTNTILDWSPLGLFYKAFAGVMTYFGVDLPSEFSGFGRMIIDGLVSGLTAFANKPLETIQSIGSGIASSFKSLLGIQSPSKVFAGFGDNITEGLALGINRSEGYARDAAFALANGTVDAAAGTAKSPAGLGGGQSGGITIHFSPSVQVSGSGQGIREQVQQGLQMSLYELEQMIDRVMEQKARRAF